MTPEQFQNQNENEADEEEIAAVLAAEQDANISEANVQKLINEGRNFRKPSKLKYAFLLTIAGCVDVLDALDFTGIGIIIAKIGTIAGTGIIYFTLWLTDSKMKRAQGIAKEMEKALLGYQKSIARATSFALQASKTMRKVPGMKGLARKIPRLLVTIRRVARKNPLTKILVGGAINLVPFVAILNLMVIWVYFSYRDEKKAFKHAREASEEASEQIETTQAI